jgi:hypothetical protein
MEESQLHRVIFAERHHGDLLISFDDGRVALYPGPLLYAAIDQPEEMIERPDELL